MARDNFRAVMEEIFRHEGGLSMTPKDPGNWTGGKVGVGTLRGTKYGIAAHANPDVNIQALTKDQAAEIYLRKYWNPIRGDDLRHGLDLVTMDAAVNSGVSRAVRWLQQAAGATPDGKIGPMTLAAANNAPDVAGVIMRACAARIGFLRGLRIWTSFGKGWSRRVAEVEAVALRMAVEAAGITSKPVLIKEKSKAETAAKRDIATAGGTGVACGGATLADVPEWALLVIAGIVVLVVINFIGRSRVDKYRADAFRNVADEVEG